MRSVQECAEQARRFVRLAAREKDPELKKRLLRHAKNHQVLARLAGFRAEVSDEALADHQERLSSARARASLPT
jgi:hypothetical protein